MIGFVFFYKTKTALLLHIFVIDVLLLCNLKLRFKNKKKSIFSLCLMKCFLDVVLLMYY